MADVMAPPAAQTPELADLQPQMTPSMETPGPIGLTASNPNSARRPPRKSTLTQQQKNQKRQRATQDQLMTLEVEFNKNPTPTAMVRERIAQDINMTERSVQIWFQNRRAKIKNIAKRSIESGEDCESIPESMRQYLAMQTYGVGKGFPPGVLGRVGPGFAPYGTGPMCLGADPSSGKVVIQHFHCRSLTIGSWRRIGQSSMDLVVFYSPDKACVTYYINNDSAGYKIEYPFAWIKNITLEQGDVSSAAEGSSQRSGGLVIELTRPPKFWMDGSGGGGFYECGDFTEDQQASQILTHQLGGPSKVLSGQLAKLISLEAYQNRHSVFDPNAFAMSAPVSPIHHRPASQPNHMLHPHSGISLFPSHDPHVGLMGPPGPRGHKRQRSRSVPAAIDFSMLRHPMPSFLIQPEGQPAQPPMQDPTIFHPVPQHQHPIGFGPGPVGPHMGLESPAGFNMGLQSFGSLPTTSANTPSEFGTPAYFAAARSTDGLQPPQFNPTFPNGFLAVDPSVMLGTSHTPLSMTSHGDPVIADHSPPLNGVGRSQSADIFSAAADNAHLTDDSLYLSETFNKQLALPFRGSISEEPFHSPMPDGMYTFQTPPATASDAKPHMSMPSQAIMTFQSPPGPSQDGAVFGTSPHHTQDSGVTFSTPQHHQDSGIAFSTSSQGSQEQHAMFQSPEDGGMLFSPDHLQSVGDEQNIFQHDPLGADALSQGFDMHQPMYGFVDPVNLGPPQH